ncbi:L-histidine N(alpha)-methyltransferase [Massilia sp. BSC265]|uniref:L-histidine N(alpha)-methyltransferase n=1 Tax=Massilia sp. BSC265 TaxID=1549812 RepID=UPI00068E3383|nr:L-histidine N(alpha)-methyltransferase [Massilia sp. BSC265]
MYISCTEDRPRAANAHVADELHASLEAHEPWISPKFLYDALGSKLFEAICELPEYYPTRTEAAILSRHGAEIARVVGSGTTLVDLGAGNCAKAASLFPLLAPAQYVAIDISAEFLCDALTRLRQRFPHIDMHGIGMDFSSRFELPPQVRSARRLFFYPGSSIGNFTPSEAQAFLRRLRLQCGSDGGVLLGIDLAKDKATLDAAYDDALGVTSAFNLNVLRHVNELIEADFDIRAWRHHGFYNPARGRVEMHLEAVRRQEVRWKGGGRTFEAGDTIHTENSYKYQQAEAIALLERSGFEATRVWTDPQRWFAVIHAQAIG